MFTDLPRLTQHLAEAATGQTRLGECGRRTRADESPMRVNLKASDLLTRVNESLVRIVAELSSSLGTPYRSEDVTSEYAGDTAKLALWLARHTHDIAGEDGAGARFDEIHAHIGRILATINRPVPPRFCGPCPSVDPADERRQCGMALMARRDALEVKCPQCGETHNVDNLMRRLLTEVDHWRFTSKEILLIMATLGDNLSDRTFRQWRSKGTVKPRGWRRPDGRISLTRHSDDDEPVYRLSDVRTIKNRSTTAERTEQR